MLRMQERTFPGFKFQKFSGGVLPQTSPLPFMRGILVTHVAFSHCYPPSNILSHRKVPFQKMPPHGKILKKGPEILRIILDVPLKSTLNNWNLLMRGLL